MSFKDQQVFNFDPPESYKSKKITYSSNENGGQTPQPKSGSKLTVKDIKNPNRPKSPFGLLSRLSREPSPNTTAANVTSKKGSKNQPKVTKISRTSEFGIQQVDGAITPIIAPPKTDKQRAKSMLPVDETGYADPDSYPMESDDVELQAIIDYIDEFYYGVRLFPGQDGSKVYVGWTTSRFHLAAEKLERNFNQKDISRCTLINTSSDGSIVSSLNRNECFVFSAIDLSQNLNDQEFSSSKIVANSVLIGCMADLAAGVISFTFNGKETGQKIQIEPGTKLYPAVFVEPTTKEVLQLELGRVKNCLPLSAAMFPSLGKHVQPKCPPRLKLQFLQPIRWSRVPNANLKVHCLKMNNVLGWSLLCEETGTYFFFCC
jgi:hypothetical protein